MSAMPSEVEGQEMDRVNRASLRLVDVASDLRRFSTPEELAARLRAAVTELQSIEQELRYLVHIDQVEGCGLLADVDKTMADIAAGWEPEAKPVDELVASLRERLNA